jgi:hypothetical protein
MNRSPVKLDTINVRCGRDYARSKFLHKNGGLGVQISDANGSKYSACHTRPLGEASFNVG